MRFVYATAFAVVLAVFGARPVPAQAPATHPRVAQALELARVWLEAQRAYDQIPGVSAAIVHDQQIVWAGAYGFADVATKREAGANTIYSICSISKLFTSVAILQQRDAGTLRLDDAVTQHLPWFKIASSEGESGPVTVEGLLTHASGLPRESDHAYWTGPTYTFPTREQIITRVSSQQMQYPSETFWQYSNLGLTLAGEVAAAASRRPYADLVRERILDPLGLTSTTPDMPAAQQGKRLATGYSGLGREGKRKPVPFFTANGIAPAAAYTGSYAATFSDTEAAVVRWEDGLALLPLPTADPMTALSKLRKVGAHTFRRVRKDGALGEPLVFEMGPDGKARRYVVHSNPYERRTSRDGPRRGKMGLASVLIK